MKEQTAESGNDDLPTRTRAVAEKAIERYARGLLTVEMVAQQMIQEWIRLYGREEVPMPSALMRLAQRVCSKELCQAWQSTDPKQCEMAYDNLQRYLRQTLLQSCYRVQLQEYIYAIEDVVNNTLEVLYTMISRKGSEGPDDPAAFLKWTQTIVIRQARLYIERYQRNVCLSLDEQRELFVEKLVDSREEDPLKQVLLREVRQVLAQTIMSMNNRRYQQVLLYSYLAEIDERELAQRLQVQVADIYLWRHRALNALRKKPEVMQTLRALLT